MSKGYLVSQLPRCRGNDERTLFFLRCYLVYQHIDRIAGANPGQGLAALRIIGQSLILPEVSDVVEQFLLAGVGMNNIISLNAVGFSHPGNVMDVQVADGSGHGLTGFVQHWMMRQGNIKDAHLPRFRSGRLTRVNRFALSLAQA